jgi:SnoaL-like protein
VSQGRVETVRALFERWNAGDHGSEAIAEFFDPAIELESPFSSVRGEPYRGYAGIEQWTRDVGEQFAEWSISHDDVREMGDRVLTVGTVDARGSASDVTLHFPYAGVVHFGRDHRVARVRIYLDVHEALKAVGLE